MLNLESNVNPFESIVNFVKALLTPTANEQRIVSDMVRSGWRENFTSERSGAGASWQPLRPFTILERQKRGYPGAHPILVQSGHLLNSLMSQGAPDSYEDMQITGDGWTLVIGTTTPYALDHELGEGRIPARPFIDLSPDAQDRVSDAIAAVVAMIEARTLK